MKQILQKTIYLFSIISLLSFGKMNAQCMTTSNSVASSTPNLAGFYDVSTQLCIPAPFETGAYVISYIQGPFSGSMSTISSSTFAPFNADVFDVSSSTLVNCVVTPSYNTITGNLEFSATTVATSVLAYGPIYPTTITEQCIDLTFQTSTNPYIGTVSINAQTPTFNCTSNPLMLQYPLPVKISEFEVINENGSNRLKWEIENHMNFSHFEIEHSFNAIEWKSLGKVDLQEKTMYSFTDKNINSKENYYRLKLVDIDGKFEYSKVVSVTNVILDEIIIVNNPIKSGNEIKIISTSEYQIFTIDGTKMNNVYSLKSGIYIVKNKEGKTAKFIVE